MEEHRLTMQEAEKINEAFNLEIREMDQVMSEAGKIISQLTKYPTFALTKGNSKVVIRRYDLLMVEENSFIAVLMTDGQQVKNKLFHLQKPLSDTQLQLLGTLLNTSFTGLNQRSWGRSWCEFPLTRAARPMSSFVWWCPLRWSAGGDGDERHPHCRHPHAAGPPGIPEPGAGRAADELPV